MSLPSCANYCFDTGLADNACGDAIDFYCQCPKSENLIAEMMPCLLNLCSSFDMTQAVIYWQSLCMIAISSMVKVPGFATDSMGIAINPTMSAPRSVERSDSLSMSAPGLQTLDSSLESLASVFSFQVSQTAPWTDGFASESGSFSTATGASFRPNTSSELSTGAKAGIAIGAVGIALALALGIWVLCRRRKRSVVANPESYAGVGLDITEKIPVINTAPQTELKTYSISPIQRKPVQHNHIYPELDNGGVVSPVRGPDRRRQNELEGQYWPAAHERRGEMPG